MPATPNVRPSPLIALGVSAIDLLCCAFVSALVMFLVLASPQVAKPARGGAIGDDTGITIKYRVETPDTIVALRFINADGDSDPVDFYSDAAKNMAVITNSKVKDALVEPTGMVFESKTPGATLADGSAGYDYVYKLSNVHAKPWDIRFAYSDTGRDMASAVPPIVRVSVYAQTTCSAQLICEIHLGESQSLMDAGCAKVSVGACDAQRILGDLAHPPAGKHTLIPATGNP